VANKLTGNPLNIDTPSPTVPIIKTEIKVRHIEFVGFAASTDSCIVTDTKGVIVAELLGATAGGDGAVRTGNVGWVDGILVTTLTSGLCLIFFE
jgi:hypothetical protein